MKAVVLAAGRGSRIASMTHGRPKCLLALGDRTLLDFQIESLCQFGARDLGIVVGHEQEQIVSHVSTHHPGRLSRIEFIVNEQFASTNNMYSLWLARHWLAGERFVCLNADVVYHPDILARALNARTDISLVIDRTFREETTRVIIEDDRVLALGKQISREEASGTFVGIAMLSGRGAHALFSRAESAFADGQRTQFFNDVIGQLAADGMPVHFSDTRDLPWAEVDDPDDLLFARTEVYPHLEAQAFSASVIAD